MLPSKAQNDSELLQGCTTWSDIQWDTGCLKMERASDEPCFLTSVHFETVRKHSWEILPCRTSRRDRTSRFASKLFSLSEWGPLKSWLFWLKRTVCLLYIMMPVLLAPGNVWSQMEFSSEFHLCVSQRALGSSSSIAYSDSYIVRMFHPDFTALTSGPKIKMNKKGDCLVHKQANS